MSEGKPAVTLKIILLGNSGVGKSSIMNRYVNLRFTNMYRATIGTDFLSKSVLINRDLVTLQIWDTAGTERFQSLGTPLYRGSHCCLLVFDVTSSASFGALDAWRKEFLVQGEPLDLADFPFIVLGNKTDLSNREVSRKKALQWCEEIGADYFEGSAKEDVGTEKPFLRAAARGLQEVMSSEAQGRERRLFLFNMFIFIWFFCLFFFDDKRYITPYSTKNTHWKIQDISR
ncbi:ras-related protein rab7 isoform X1 [Kryptolebias marmoratus]|uniref:ras-related protein rab7 isoform X1 n=1 Tax=Kryptolebias marmoratus TaxID=37003 RepID=UPI0007F93813|nr:ras-related protein rab7 isoform X1 [Kryptolebias marmoratus]